MSVISDTSAEGIPYTGHFEFAPPKDIDPQTLQALESYKSAIESLAAEGSDFIFPNSSGFHAAVVLSVMIRHAKERFRIYDDELNGDLTGHFDAFNEIIPSLFKHVKRGGTIEVVVRSGGVRESPIYEVLKSLAVMFKNLVSVRVASPEFKKLAASIYEKDINFATGDDLSFRLEEYIDAPRNRKAICSFQQPEYAKELNEVFDKEFANCAPVF